MAWVWFDTEADIVRAINELGEKIVSALQDAVNDLGGWGVSWRDRAKAAEALAAEAVAAKQASDQALADFAADDAATDLQQLVEAEAANTQVVVDKLAELKAGDAPVEEAPVVPVPEAEPAPPEPEPVNEPAPEPEPVAPEEVVGPPADTPA